MSEKLPIYSLLPDLKKQLQKTHEAIVEASPGAGKTTVIPLELLSEPWLQKRKIVMLEPRRLAAKNAAKRLADMLNEPLGQRVGYRIRHEYKESAETKILVVTEGILTQMLQSDPSLDDVALVIFDEFHERNLHADLSFVLCLQAREVFREEAPLKLLIMSATLNTAEIEKKLGCPALISKGRSFPVDIRYANKNLKVSEDIIHETTRLVSQAIQNDTGSILVFLPGRKEIQQVASWLLKQFRHDPHLSIQTLYADMDFKEQENAIEPAVFPQRKVVLATSIAQTSLTINGIRIVVDSGLSREARFNANTATTHLHTRRATQAETIQRMGRAGRIEEGICYRWWSEEQQYRLPQQAQPEIEISNLDSLVLEMAKWGIKDRLELDWITPPPKGNWSQSIDHLVSLGAIKSKIDLGLSPLGKQMAKLSLSPRFSRLLVEGVQQGSIDIACTICALLSEGDPFKHSYSDFTDRILWLQGKNNIPSHYSKKTYLLSKKQWLKQSQHLSQTSCPHNEQAIQTITSLLLFSFTDRLAQRISQNSQVTQYKLANGRLANLPSNDPVSQNPWLIALETGGMAGKEDKIYLAYPVKLDEILEIPSNQLQAKQHINWSKKEERLICEHQYWIGKLCIKTQPYSPSEEEVCQSVCEYIRQEGLSILPWDSSSKHLKSRLLFAFQHDDQHQWPDVTDHTLLDNIEKWLTPYLGKVTTQATLNKLPLDSILYSLIPWDLQRILDQKVPTKITLSSSVSYPLNYQGATPVLSVKLQEMFGTINTPHILKQPIRIELLSPAKRPLAITQDLAFFWKNVYPDVRKEMRGRYPKHPWPEDPLTAKATSKTKMELKQN